MMMSVTEVVDGSDVGDGDDGWSIEDDIDDKDEEAVDGWWYG